MGSAVLEMPKGACSPIELGMLGAFFEPTLLEPTPEEEANLTRPQERLIKALMDVLTKQLIVVAGARSEDEFRTTRENAWPKYIRSLRALHDTVTNVVGEDQVDRMSDEGFPIFTSDLQKQASRFGDKLTEQALFTLWTMGKIRPLAKKIDSIPVPVDKQEADRTLFKEYVGTSLWSQFHLDILISAMKLGIPVAEEIRESVINGLRAAVNAYTIMREALALRQMHVEETATVLPWDEEDERLLASSMRDIKNALSDDR